MTTRPKHGDLQEVPTFEYAIVTSTERDHRGQLVPKGKRFDYDAATGQLIKSTDRRLGRLSEGTIERFTHRIDDMRGFMEALHDQPNRKILLNALPPPTAEFITTKPNKLKLALDARYVPKSQDWMKYPSGPHHGYFDNDWETYYGQLLSIDALVEALRTHCPEFRNVTLGTAVSASNCIYAPDGTLLRPILGNRIRFIADDGAQIPRIIHSVAIRMALAGFRYLKQQSNRLDPKTVFDSVTGSSDRCDYIGASYLTGGAYQKKPEPIIFEGSQRMLRTADVPDAGKTFSEFTHKDEEYRRMLGKPQAKAKAQELLDDWAERTAAKGKRTPAELKKQVHGGFWDGDQPFEFDNGETYSLNELFLMGSQDDYVDEYHASPHEPERDTQLCVLRKRGLDDWYSYDYHYGTETPIRHDHSIADEMLASTPLTGNVVQLHPPQSRQDGRSVEDLMPHLSQRFTPLAVALAATDGDMTAIAHQLITTAQLTPVEAVRVLNASVIGSAGNAYDVVSGLLNAPMELGGTVKATKTTAAPYRFQPQTLRDIMLREHQEPEWLVDGLIPEGTVLLAGRPKKGKSWMALQLALAVASGGMFLGRQCAQGNVIYLSLEDPERRIKKRTRLLLYDATDAAVACLSVYTRKDNVPRFDQGLGDALRELLRIKPHKLVIFDTLKKVRPLEGPRTKLYDGDYEAVQHVQEITSEFEGTTGLVIHHTRKMDADDPFDTLSGSTGLTGASDMNIVLHWDKSVSRFVLSGQGREGDFELAVAHDKITGVWDALGAPEQVSLTEVRKKIMEALKDAPMKPKDIAEITGLTGPVVRNRLGDMLKAQQVTKDADGNYSVCVLVGEDLTEEDHASLQG